MGQNVAYLDGHHAYTTLDKPTTIPAFIHQDIHIRPEKLDLVVQVHRGSCLQLDREELDRDQLDHQDEAVGLPASQVNRVYGEQLDREELEVDHQD